MTAPDECGVCREEMDSALEMVLVCDALGCEYAAHRRCHSPATSTDGAAWYCPECVVRLGPPPPGPIDCDAEKRFMFRPRRARSGATHTRSVVRKSPRKSAPQTAIPSAIDTRQKRTDAKSPPDVAVFVVPHTPGAVGIRSDAGGACNVGVARISWFRDGGLPSFGPGSNLEGLRDSVSSQVISLLQLPAHRRFRPDL
jgi:hypothetical protein